MAKISSAEDRVTVQFTHVDNPPVDANSQLGRALALQLVGEPAHAGLGNYIYSKRLFELPGKGLPLGFSEVAYNLARRRVQRAARPGLDPLLQRRPDAPGAAGDRGGDQVGRRPCGPLPGRRHRRVRGGGLEHPGQAHATGALALGGDAAQPQHLRVRLRRVGRWRSPTSTATRSCSPTRPPPPGRSITSRTRPAGRSR